MNAKQFIRQLQERARQSGRAMRMSLTTRHCGWYGCEGYHPFETIVAYPSGELEYWPSPVGVHSRIYPSPRPRKISPNEAARLAARMLRDARKAFRDPFLSWKDVLETVDEALE